MQLVHEEIAPEFALPPQPAGGSGPARPHEKFGWYSQSTIENLRRLLKQSLQTLAKAQSDPTAASTHALGQPTSRTLLQHSAPPPTSSAAAAAYTPSAVVGIAPGTARASSGAVKGTAAAVPPPAAMESRMHTHLGRGALRLPVEAAGGSLAATAGGLPAVGAVEGISAASDGLVEGISAASDDLVEGVAAAVVLAARWPAVVRHGPAARGRAEEVAAGAGGRDGGAGRGAAPAPGWRSPSCRKARWSPRRPQRGGPRRR